MNKNRWDWAGLEKVKYLDRELEEIIYRKIKAKVCEFSRRYEREVCQQN